MNAITIACPCCGYKTFSERPGEYGICPVCYWEDDPHQRKNPDYTGGANAVSLRQGQKNFQELGVCEPALATHVRKPYPDEHREPGWKFLEST